MTRPVTGVRRALIVLTLGALLVTAATLFLWAVGLRGPGGTAMAIAVSTGTMQLVDDRLARHPRAPWRAAAMAVVGGATAWTTMTWLVG
jgi:hypothetical protein